MRPPSLSSLAAQRAEIARAERRRRRHPDEPDQTVELRRQYAGAKLAEYIQRVVDDAPPLDEVQRDRLALLLRGGGAEPPGGPVAPSIRREHESRDSGSVTPESLSGAS